MRQDLGEELGFEVIHRVAAHEAEYAVLWCKVGLRGLGEE